MARPYPAVRRVLVACLIGLLLGAIAPTADTTVQPVPFAQDWINPELITASDDWSGVPGIVGYRGDGLASTTGVDPQTVLGEGTPVVDVNANQPNPNTFATGGVAEFAAAGAGGNAVVALQGSGTARAPNLVVSVTTTGLSTVVVSYNVRDIDGSADNAVQQVALQYRVGTAGPFTNLPGGFVADATTGPNAATLVTPVSVTLPAAAAGQPVVQIRILTTDAATSDEWVGIDDIAITGSVVVEPTNPSGTAAASPNSVESGSPVLLTVAVTPGENPASTGLGVTANLGAIGGSTTQPLFDDATNGDATAGDRTFSFLATVDNATTTGSKSLAVTIHDAEGRTGSAAISLAVTTPPAPVTTDVVISQVYGGGGNSGATYTHDFIELFNRGTSPVTLTGWSLQYASAAGSTWSVDPISGVIPPGQYFLVQEAQGSGGTTPLPPPDDTGGLAMSGTAGKIALVGNATALSGTCPSGAAIADFVGYGTSASCFEGSGPTPTLSNTTAAIRVDPGVDTNDNALDFREGAPAPHNVSGIPPSGAGRATPGAVPSGGSTLLTVTVTPGAAPASASFSVSADLSSIGIPAVQTFYDDGVTGGDVAANDRIFSWTASIAGDPGFRTIAATITDDLSRTASVAIRLAVEQTTTLAISTLQGSSATSTFDGQFVTTAGVVTAHRSNGYFIQTPDGQDDGNPLTSEGLFVFTGFGAPMPAAGDAVRVSGAVAEFAPETIAFARPTTEISGGPAFIVISSGHALPAPVAADARRYARRRGNRSARTLRGDARAREPPGRRTDRRHEVRERPRRRFRTATSWRSCSGWLVPRANRGSIRLRAFPRERRPPSRGSTVTSNGCAWTATGAAAPGSRSSPGRSSHDMTGVLDHAGTTYTFLPDPLAWTPAGNASAVPVPAPTENEFTVASFNMERLFDDVNGGGDDVTMTAEGYERRLRKASLAVRTVMLSPDIIGVEEVEHETTLAAVAARINADAVAATGTDPQYVARLFEGNDPGGIDVGFLVKTSRVDIVSVTQVGKDDDLRAARLERRPLSSTIGRRSCSKRRSADRSARRCRSR